MGWLKRLFGSQSIEAGEEHAERTCGPVGEGGYAVVILDDDLHSGDFVIEMLADLCDMPRYCGYGLALRITKLGRAAVYRGTVRQCERMKRYIEDYGPDKTVPGSIGSVRAVVEKWTAE